MEVVMITGAIRRAKLQSRCHQWKPTLTFLQAGCPFRRPTNNVKAVWMEQIALTYETEDWITFETV